MSWKALGEEGQFLIVTQTPAKALALDNVQQFCRRKKLAERSLVLWDVIVAVS